MPGRLPALLNAAGVPDVVDQLKQGYDSYGRTYKVPIDGYNITPYLSGDVEEHSRPDFMYFSDEVDLVAMRYHNWKWVFMKQRMPGTLVVWANPFTPLRVPKILNLRTDPFELADRTSNTYWDTILRPLRPRPGLRREVPGHVQGVPAPHVSPQLQRRQGS